MDFVISASRAVQEGNSPEHLLQIADWHDERAAWAEGQTKKRSDKLRTAARHSRVAKSLRAVAAEIAAMPQKAAA